MASLTSAIKNEKALATLAKQLIGGAFELTRLEEKLTSKRAVATSLAEATKRSIQAGNDPLGDIFCILRSPEVRRHQGATFTPQTIVDAMIKWAASQDVTPTRIVDPGCGSGRFLCAAAKIFPSACLVGVEIDPLAALLLKANAVVLGFSERLMVIPGDYRRIALPEIGGATLFIGNPPYVRHHQISEEWKKWFGTTASSLGFTASKLAGLHIHFFLKTRALANPGDFGAFITAAEWIDVNYGRVLREMLADGLGGTSLHVLDARSRPFADAMTTGAITCFRVGQQTKGLTLAHVDSLKNLNLEKTEKQADWVELNGAPKWSVFLKTNSPRPASGFVELGELFRVSRGQVTGSNDIWISGDHSALVPSRFLLPTVTRARELISAEGPLRSAKNLKKVIDLPIELNNLSDDELAAVHRFLRWAKSQGAHQSYVARHRRAWWAVGLYEPAPILCTYMARRAPVFVVNKCRARHLNIAHGLYPREKMSSKVLEELCRMLSANINTEGGRTYAGGLIKFEPREMERVHIPHPDILLSA